MRCARWLGMIVASRSPGGVGAGHAGGRLHAARRHAVDSGGRDPLPDYTFRRTRKSPMPTATSSTGTRSTSAAPTSTSPATSRTSSRSASRRTSRARRTASLGRQRRLNGSLVFRIKYAYAQFNLDDWMTRGSWARLGIQQTPWVDFEEGIYRYRFQGTVFAERERLLTRASPMPACRSTTTSRRTTATSTSASTTARTTSGSRSTIRRRFEFRGTRPAVRDGRAGAARAARRTSFYDDDHYVERRRAQARCIGSVTFEHHVRERRVRLPGRQGSDVGRRHRRRRAAATRSGRRRGCRWPEARRGKGCCATTTGCRTTRARSRPRRSPAGSASRSATRSRTGRSSASSYWFPHQGNVQHGAPRSTTTARASTTSRTAPTKSVAVHGLVNF